MKRSASNRSTRMPLVSVTSTWRSLTIPDVRKLPVSEPFQEKERVLDAALDEYCQLREAGQSLTASDFCRRYPTYRKSLRRLIDVHETLDQFADVDQDQWPAIGTEFLGFELLRELGKGAFARVYLATEPALGGRAVAIKVALYGSDEAETLGKLAHPNVVPVHSVQIDPETGMTAVCMPYLGSATLADVLEVAFETPQPPKRAAAILDAVAKREQFVGLAELERTDHRGRLEGSYVDGVIDLGIQMADALAYTHEQGVLHRDLKPSNVLVTPDGRPMLLDFNLSCDAKQEANRLGGTLPYMPPEQIRDVYLHPYDARLDGGAQSDIFSLGVILYELLTGRLPFGEPPSRIVPQEAGEAYLKAQATPPRPIHELNPDVDAATAGLIARCLDLAIENRPANAKTLALELAWYFSRSQRLARWSRRHWLALSAVGSLMFVSSSLAGVHLATRDPYPIRLYKDGLRAWENKRFDKAIELFSTALRRDPDYDQARFARGLSFQEIGNYSEALNDLQAIQGAQSDPLVLECLAFSRIRYLRSGGSSAGSAAYAELMERFPERQELAVNYGYMCRNMPEKAIRIADDAIQQDPDLQNAYLLRVEANYLMLYRRLRLAASETTGTDNVSHTLARTNWELYRDALIEELLADIQRARIAGPLNPWLEFRLAWTLAQQAKARPERQAELLPLIRNHLAVVAGKMSRKTFHTYVEDLDVCAGAPWFRDLQQNLPMTDDDDWQFDPAYFIITPPDADAIRARLQAPRRQ